MTTKTSHPCPSCEGQMRRGVRDQQVEYHGQSHIYRQPGWWCEECDDGILGARDNEVADAALHEVMARAKKSPISPLLIRAAREAVGVSQREAGRLFGGGPTAFYKYESAKAVPSEDVALVRRVVKDNRLTTPIISVYPEASEQASHPVCSA